MNRIIIFATTLVSLAMLIFLSLHREKQSVQQESLTGSPALFLWAWQRQENLNFIDADTTVALWIATLDISETIIPDLRQNSITLPKNTSAISVVRIEALQKALPDVGELADTIMTIFLPTHAKELQIDFDATVSQRQFYRDLLLALKNRLNGIPLSITALASWCLNDPWIDALPITYAVPMLYRMGHDSARINQQLATDSHFSASICQHNIGYSLDEMRMPLGNMQRIFIFNNAPWNEESFAAIKEELLLPATTQF